MSSKHSGNYLQKYCNFFSFAIIIFILYACSTTRKVPNGEYLLTKNHLKYNGQKVFKNEVEGYISQKPNRKELYLFPVSLWLYNWANPKYDSILSEYATYPKEMRNQKLRDSLFVKYHHPEYLGKSIIWSRMMHNWGQPPTILDNAKTEASTKAINNYLIYRGYWDASVRNEVKLNENAKKAEVTYKITPKDPTYINGYYYLIPDPEVKRIFVESVNKTLVKNKSILDQTNLENEGKRITEMMRENGYYNFNESNQEIYFVADTLNSKKQVPLTLEIHKDNKDTPYKITNIDSINVYVVDNTSEVKELKKPDSTLLGIHFYTKNNDYKNIAIWRQIIPKTGDIYNQNSLNQTKRNLYNMNNFSLSEEIIPRKDKEGIIDLKYILVPLPKYDLRFGADINYSQILNWGASPSIDLLTRNIFGGAQNLNTSLSGTFGTVQNPKNPDKRISAYEISAQATLTFPKLLLPFQYYKIIPKRYSPSSFISLGASKQDNIGLGRIGFNAGLTYQALVNDVITHQLTLFNTQFSFTKNKEKYYDYFTGEKNIVDQVHQAFFSVRPDIGTAFNNGQVSYDQVSSEILNDPNFVNNYTTSNSQNQDLYDSFLQSLINKDRQTQDVLVSSLIYNFVYNEIGRKDRINPFFFNGKVEFAGNIFGLLNLGKSNTGIVEGESKKIFGIPYSQFVKFDIDVRKYLSINKSTLVLRQFIGLGIPYGNSVNMPFIRSYFNGGSNDIRAWRVFGGLGPSDVQLDEKVRAYIMDNVKLTTNIEYRFPLNKMFEGATFIDAGNIWSLKDNGSGDQFTFKNFLSQMGIGAGLGLRINFAYITFRLDAAYKVYDPNIPVGQRWVIQKWQPFKPVLNFAFGYPF